MRKCDYYLCTRAVYDDVEDCLGFCDLHLKILDELIEKASGEDDQLFRNAVAYCLAAINGKAYLHSYSVH